MQTNVCIYNYVCHQLSQFYYTCYLIEFHCKINYIRGKVRKKIWNIKEISCFVDKILRKIFLILSIILYYYQNIDKKRERFTSEKLKK